MLQVLHPLHIVGRACIKEETIQTAAHIIHSHAAHTQLHNTHALPSIPHHNLGIVGTVITLEMKFLSHTETVGERRDTPSAIPAHRTQAPVTVIIFHLEIKFRILRILQRHQPVGTHAETPVTQAGYLFLIKSNRTVAVVDNHKIVTRPIKLIKRNLHLEI